MKKSRWAKVGGLLTGLAFVGVLVFGEAEGNSASFAWTMNLREVDGARNSRLHHLESGELMLEGKVWITEKVRGANPKPVDITIEVLKDELGLDSTVCSVVFTPSRILNERRDFSRSYGRVETGTYYIVAAKPYGKDDIDGWHNQGAGSLTTK